MGFKLFLFLMLYKVCLLESQRVKTSCPMFEYVYDNRGVRGHIQLPPLGSVSAIILKVNFTIAASLPSSYIGRLEYLGGNNFPNRNGNGNAEYNVHFPVSQPLPRLTALIVNNNLLCYASGDIPLPGQVVITISLQHAIYMQGGNRPFFNNDFYVPQQPPVVQPQPDPFIYNPPQNNYNYDYNNNNNNNNKYPNNKYPNNNNYNPGQSNQQPTTSLYSEFPIFSKPAPATPPPPPPVEDIDYYRPVPQHSNNLPDSNSECGTIDGENRAALIYQGDFYERGEWPWLVALYRTDELGLRFICAGTLVTDRHVVTAAHCMQQKSSRTTVKEMIVRVGVFNLEDWDDDITLTRSLQSAKIHEKYNPRTLEHDVLVITLHKKVKFSEYIRAACLWNSDASLEKVVNRSAVVAGWGESEDGPSGKGRPRAVRIPIVSTSTCRSTRKDFHELTSSFTLCAGDRNGSGPCSGDSGGGLYLKENGRWRLRGIVSLSLRPTTGDKTCDLNEFLVFTDAAQYLPWIKNVISTT